MPGGSGLGEQPRTWELMGRIRADSQSGTGEVCWWAELQGPRPNEDGEIVEVVERSRLVAVEQERDRLREALEFYAARDNWIGPIHNDEGGGVLTDASTNTVARRDGGWIARKALSADAREGG